jgi:cellulose synthase/poly-beta-1,6-N-acetylglucosamine synthase-like glycosyltransferase
MRLLFWLSAAIIVYVYAGYPLLLALWARVAGRRGRQETADASAAGDRASAPGISIVIAARNEAARLPARIRNLLESDYPGAARQIIVVSDGSTDGTEAALAPFAAQVELVTIPEGGKALALNAGVARARHEILVFADARQIFAPDTLRALVAPFADASIAGVSGELILGCEPAGRRDGHERRASNAPVLHDRRAIGDRRAHLCSTVADAVGFYWRYEKHLRHLETQIGSMLGATGAVYALRRSCWTPLPAGTLLDDVLAPMRAVLRGGRVVFEPGARAFDWTAQDSEEEGRRKIRTLAGNFQILWLEPRLLVPFANPVWVQYVSHKVGRLVVPYALVGLMTASIALAAVHPLYAAALAAQCAMYLLGGYGALLELEARPVRWGALAKAPREVLVNDRREVNV